MTVAPVLLAGRGRAAAWVLGAVGLVELALTVAGALASSVDLLGSYALTNLAFGIGFGGCGFVLARHRPANPIGWLLLAGAVAHLTSAAAAPWLSYGLATGWPEPVTRLLATVFLGVWPLGVLLAFPLALLLFPTGTPASPRWHWAIRYAVGSGALFTAYMASEPESQGGGRAGTSYLAALGTALGPVWTAVSLTVIAVPVLVVASLVTRFRRGDETARRQLLWLVLAGILAFGLNAQRWLTEDGPILLLLTFQLVPIAVAIAIVRHQLLDIRLVVSRTVLYLLLTLGVVAAYTLLVAALDALVRDRVGVRTGVVATVVVALCANPVRLRLQGLVDQLFYGDRANPVAAVSRLGRRLTDGDGDLRAATAAVAEALRLPYAGIRADGTWVATTGVEPAVTETVPLRLAGEPMGELVVGVRAGQRRLSDRDGQVLALVAGPLAVALHATVLTEEVRASRGRIVAAREEERRRLRRDLHDGLGSVLTGVAYKLDAARNGVRADPDRTATLLGELRTETGAALADIRRLVYGLRPPALDELGLVSAVRRLSAGPALLTVDAAADLTGLSAAVEVAAYRIVAEALTNVTRHSGAAAVRVRLGVAGGALRIEVADDGRPGSGEWRPGVGVASMRERAAEVGGWCTAEPTAAGGLVTAELPLAGASIG